MVKWTVTEQPTHTSSQRTHSRRWHSGPVRMLLFRAAATSVLSRHLLGGIFPNVFSPSYALSQLLLSFSCLLGVMSFLFYVVVCSYFHCRPRKFKFIFYPSAPWGGNTSPHAPLPPRLLRIDVSPLFAGAPLFGLRRG